MEGQGIWFSIVLHVILLTLAHGFLSPVKDHIFPTWITVPRTMPTTTPRVPTIQPVCKNNILNCADYGSPDYACHGQFQDWAKQNCNQYCGFCKGLVAPTAQLIMPTIGLPMPTTALPMPTTALPMPTTASTIPTTSILPTTSTICMDKISNCKQYGEKAYTCHGQFEPWARLNCALYCGFCTTPTTTPRVPTTQPVCKNNIRNCADYGSPDYACHGQFKDWAKQNCNQYCGFCISLVMPTAQLIKPTIGLPMPPTALPMPTTALPMPTTASTIPITSILPTTSTICMDKVSNCKQYGEKAYTCHGQFEPWARLNCALYCGFCSCGSATADIHFLLDSSASLGSGNFHKQKDFVARFAQTFDIGPRNVQIGVTTFSTSVHQQFYMNAYGDKASLVKAIRNIPYQSGSTHTDKAIHFVAQNAFTKAHGDRDHVVNILITMTDGQSTKMQATITESNALHRLPIESFAIGIGGGINKDELNHIASDNTKVFTVSNFDALNTIKAEFRKSVCQGQTNVCVYKGQTYQQGQTWDDGCEYKCTCDDASQGRYTCNAKCTQWKLPNVCTLEPPAAGKCCKTPKCPSNVVINYPPGYTQE